MRRTDAGVEEMRGIQSWPPVSQRSHPQPTPSSINAQRSRTLPLPAAMAVFENPDLVAIILSHAQLEPFAFAAIGRVAKAWHAARHADEALVLAAARRPDFLTKRTIMGLFALHWHEADKLPRGMRARRNGGWMYMYGPAAIHQAFAIVGGMPGWQRRIAERAKREKAALATKLRGRN